MFLGIGPGDEVIVPSMTHVATAHAVELCGATCVFADATPETGNLDLDQVESLITERTRALSVVHFLGHPVDMRRVMALAERHGLFVVEDCALALGARIDGTHVGLFGDVGCFSFYPVKHITTAEGGMLITRRPDLAARAGMQRAFGIDRNIVRERPLPGDYDVLMLGNNYRMNEIGAALGLEQLRRLPDFLERRRANHAALTAALSSIPGIDLFEPPASSGVDHAHYCHAVILKDDLSGSRSGVMAHLNARGVGTSVYYPRPVPLMTYFRTKYGFSDTAFPAASRLSDRSIALPVGPHLGLGEMHRIASMVMDAIDSVR
jgi:dTDP-4-amino-4,6-dideoxygalactose transaminase